MLFWPLFHLRKRSSSPVPAWGPLPWKTVLQSSFSNMDPSHSLQLFYRLLQNGSFPQGAVPWEQTAGSPTGLQPPLGIPLLQCVSSVGCRWISAYPWMSTGCKGTAASPWSVPQAAGEFELQSLEHLLPFLLHWPWCLQGCFSQFFTPLFCGHNYLCSITYLRR